jgi:hypothetical protein
MRGKIVLVTDVEEGHVVGEGLATLGHALDAVGAAEQAADKGGSAGAGLDGVGVRVHKVADGSGKLRDLAGDVIFAEEDEAGASDGVVEDLRAGAGELTGGEDNGGASTQQRALKRGAGRGLRRERQGNEKLDEGKTS